MLDKLKSALGKQKENTENTPILDNSGFSNKSAKKFIKVQKSVEKCIKCIVGEFLRNSIRRSQ